MKKLMAALVITVLFATMVTATSNQNQNIAGWETFPILPHSVYPIEVIESELL